MSTVTEVKRRRRSGGDCRSGRRKEWTRAPARTTVTDSDERATLLRVLPPSRPLLIPARPYAKWRPPRAFRTGDEMMSGKLRGKGKGLETGRGNENAKEIGIGIGGIERKTGAETMIGAGRMAGDTTTERGSRGTMTTGDAMTRIDEGGGGVSRSLRGSSRRKRCGKCGRIALSESQPFSQLGFPPNQGCRMTGFYPSRSLSGQSISDCRMMPKHTSDCATRHSTSSYPRKTG